MNILGISVNPQWKNCTTFMLAVRLAVIWIPRSELSFRKNFTSGKEWWQGERRYHSRATKSLLQSSITQKDCLGKEQLSGCRSWLEVQDIFSLAIRSILSYHRLVMWSLRKLLGYTKWFEGLRLKEVGQVEARLKRIVDEDHFGSVRDLGDGLWELKFNNGNRIYYARTGRTELTLILGGDKNGQDRDIKKAKSPLNE